MVDWLQQHRDFERLMLCRNPEKGDGEQLGERKLVDKPFEQIEPGVDGSGVEGEEADEDDSPYMALATSSLCNIFSGRGAVILYKM